MSQGGGRGIDCGSKASAKLGQSRRNPDSSVEGGKRVEGERRGSNGGKIEQAEGRGRCSCLEGGKDKKMPSKKRTHLLNNKKTRRGKSHRRAFVKDGWWTEMASASCKRLLGGR